MDEFLVRIFTSRERFCHWFFVILLSVSYSSVQGVAPEFSSSPQNVRVIEENKVTVTLNCTVYGNPTPDVKWTKDEIELSKNDRINVSEIVGNTSSLTITNTVREDEGQYRCVASNSVNTTISSPGKLTVNFRADVAISGSELKFVEISKQIQLTCQYTASPPVSEVQWVKDGNVIARNKSGIGIGSVNITQFTENQSQLRISSSKKQDEGNYTCFVKNAVGTSSDVTSVLIQVIPDPPQNITVDSKGSRVVSISWTPGSSGNSDIKNYTVEISEDNQNFSDVVCQGSLSNGACVVSSPSTTASLTGLFPWTTYNIRVFATNKIGRSNSSSILNVTTYEEVPSEAPSFDVTVLNSTAVNVSWQMLSKDKARGAILGYYVLYRVKENTPPWINKTVGGAGITSLLLGPLNEHTMYEFAMQAVNSKGVSNISALVEKTTDQHKPSGPPDQVTLSEVTSTSIKVTWTSVDRDDRNGIIKGYKVLYRALPNGDNVTTFDNVTIEEQGTERTLAIEGLNEFTNYSIRVLAFTVVGDGPLSGAKFAKTREDKPNLSPQVVIVTVVSSKSIFVSWSPVPLQDRNGIIKGYRVIYQALPNGNNETETVNITTNDQDKEQTLTLEELNEFTDYSIRVLAFTAEGDGPLSVAKVNHTLEDKPSLSPQAVVVTVESSRSIIVSWSPVLIQDRNGIIKGYKVIYQALPNGNNETKTVNITINDQDKGQTLTLEKLNEFTIYRIRVLAFTAVGDGPLSVSKVNQTLEDEPSLPPQAVVVMVESSRSIIVSWSPVPIQNRNGIIKGYQVIYQALPNGNNETKTVNITINDQDREQTLTLEKLNEFTNYRIRVLAFTAVGDGPLSVAKFKQTLEDEPSLPPQAVVVTVESSRSIIVSWSPVPIQDRNGIIKGYKVVYQALPNGNNETVNITINDQDKEQTLTLEELNEFTNYSIRVLAFTAIGDGSLSVAKVNQTLEDQPSLPPQAVVVTVESSRSIIVSWSPVLLQDRNGIIKGYKVLYQALPNGNNETETVNITSNDQDKGQTLTIRELNEFTNYSIRVLAFTAVGDGRLSAAKVNRTLEDKPTAAPSNVTGRNTSSTSILVEWDDVPAFEQNGIITNYTIFYRSQSEGDK
ncbi:protein sidekick-1-like isoform X1 [Stylophora pistillata]|uniref:protein sidekick-1-like isoform X1 n=1 Tax=Stylophora pistillata TaxID=50429 RepID=UPI000C051F7A|nr:protein sidekick-1-like isoform X1 [Stylophora pistillata]